MPDPRPHPRYRLALIGAFVAFSLALVGLGVRLGTAGIIGGTDRGPAVAGIGAAGAIVDLEASPAAPAVGSLDGQAQADQGATRPASGSQGQLPRAEPTSPAPAPAASPAPQPAPNLGVPAPAPAPLQPPAPVPPPPSTDPLLAPVAPVLDSLLGGDGALPPPVLPGI